MMQTKGIIKMILINLMLIYNRAYLVILISLKSRIILNKILSYSQMLMVNQLILLVIWPKINQNHQRELYLEI